MKLRDPEFEEYYRVYMQTTKQSNPQFLPENKVSLSPQDHTSAQANSTSACASQSSTSAHQLAA